MDSTIGVSFRYTQSDYLRATRANFGSRRRLWFDIAVVVIVAVLGLYLLASQDERWIGSIFLGLSAIFVSVLVAGFTIIPYLVFRRTPKFHDEYSLVFSSEGIHFRTAHIDSQLQWGMYSRALVDAHSYLLYYGPRSFTIIPKRVFEDAQQQETFEQLLARHIRQIVRRG